MNAKPAELPAPSAFVPSGGTPSQPVGEGTGPNQGAIAKSARYKRTRVFAATGVLAVGAVAVVIVVLISGSGTNQSEQMTSTANWRELHHQVVSNPE